MLDTNINTVRPGDPVTADLQNEIIQGLLASIIVGPGLTLTRQGGKLTIALADNNPQIIPK